MQDLNTDSTVNSASIGTLIKITPVPEPQFSSEPVLSGIDKSVVDARESTDPVDTPTLGAPDITEDDNLWVDITNQLGFSSAISHTRIDQRLDFYKGNQQYFDRISRRAELYMPYIVAQLKQRDLPLELALLPVIESAYNPFSYSSSAAAGLWQFIPATATYMGLKQDWWYDGRKDIIASTDAALRYLDYLHGRFDGDWLLALAAYNGGEGRLRRAIRRKRDKGLPADYWSLKHSAETNAYVPQFLALIKIISNPEAHGIKLKPIKSQMSFDVVSIGQSIDLPQAAVFAGISIDDLYKLNPGFLRRASPPSQPTRIVLPVAAIPQFKQSLSKASESSWQAVKQYVVQSGDTLSEIAQRKHVTLKTLKKINHLTSYRIIQGQILKIPGTGISSQVALPGFLSIAANYRIRRGDTLSGIAKKYRVPLNELMVWNQLSKSTILKPGQRITIKPMTNGQRTISGGSRKVNYQVKKGDSLYGIALQFKIAMRDIVKWNNLKNKNRLFTGQTLVLYLRFSEKNGPANNSA